MKSGVLVYDRENERIARMSAWIFASDWRTIMGACTAARLSTF